MITVCIFYFSNLTCLNTGSSATADKKNQSQKSDDSSSSTEDDTRAVILTNERGTSSLQLSDSDDDISKVHKSASSSAAGNQRSSGGSLLANNRRKSANQVSSNQQIPDKMDQSSSNSLNNVNASKKLINVDTDSVNENFSPVRPSTKRKRKFKRMALDPAENTTMMMSMESPMSKGGKTGTIKRKKVRSKSACDSSSVTSKSRSATLKSPKGANAMTRQRQVSTANVVPGKRKRSSREKSVEPDLMVLSQSSVPSHSMITEEVLIFYWLPSKFKLC